METKTMKCGTTEDTFFMGIPRYYLSLDDRSVMVSIPLLPDR